MMLSSKNIENFGIISTDLVTGFDDSFGNSTKFKLSVGTEITRISKNFPIRLGLCIGGRQPSSYTFGFGLTKGPMSIDFSRKYYYGLILSRAKGVEYGINVYFDFNDFSSQDFFNIKFPKIKLPQLPKLPD